MVAWDLLHIIPCLEGALEPWKLISLPLPTLRLCSGHVSPLKREELRKFPPLQGEGQGGDGVGRRREVPLVSGI